MNRRRLHIAAGLICICLVRPGSANAQRSDERANQLDGLLADLARPNEPGVAVLVRKHGRVIYRSARGLANLDTSAPLTVETPIYVASVAKQFTAMAILQLAERKKLALDDPACKYVPELQPFAPTVTIRQLLTHTSGLPDHLTLMKDEVARWTNDDVLKLLRKENRLLFEPGSKTAYSNSGYVVLAIVVERLTGRTLAEVFEDEIFKPAGMKQTFIPRCNAATPASVAHGYRATDGVWREDAYNACTTGAGGVFSTAVDLAQFDAALESGRIVKRDSLLAASTPAVLTTGKPTAYGFGWLAEFDATGPLANIWYTAAFWDFKGYRGLMKRIPDRQLTIIVLTNRGNFPWPLVKLIHDLYA